MSKSSRSQDKLAAKKAAVLGDKKSGRRLHFALWGVCAAVLVGGGVFFLGQEGEGAPPVAKVFAAGSPSGEVNYPVAQFDDGKGRFFAYQAPDGLTIRYFVLKSSDGVIRSAFDACDSCWHAGKGYRQEGDDMVCRNCGQHFPSVKVNVVKGGCNPAPLPNQVRDGQLVIRVADLLAGRNYFDLAKGS